MQSSTFNRHNKGHELVFQADSISTVLLCMLLASVLKDMNHAGIAIKPPVLTIIGSDTMYLSKFQSAGPVFPRMDDSTVYERMKQYMVSKLLLILFVRQLAQQISPGDVAINALGRKVRSGASVYIHTLLGEGKRGHGSFISDWTIKPYGRLLYTKEGQDLSERLWQETMEELRFTSEKGIKRLFA
ncbi:hypothetical protein Asppvi_004456 [Aspergillus pseudoviridinutans]|uniref:Uncharacterized protein n=1 Tax=Aspergillus pseudoviridinutans TaxID=1517512 RepID=A0A9P3ETE1_9EURO|nr:uncharacterized protein Asppvi_004456 [Aspergillus pseudoviridinutans]GIJ85597.1 hypothetical protein Asppvi_004456 [Aspergillus pseudoviridinutans]